VRVWVRKFAPFSKLVGEVGALEGKPARAEDIDRKKRRSGCVDD